MHELPYNPMDYGSSEGPPLFPCRPTVKIVLAACNGKPISACWLARQCGFVRSDVPWVLFGGRAIRMSDRCFRALRA
jgi:hypothetical protein